MSYELINQELNLWSCSVSDLTMDQVKCFLGQWSDGSKINSLTVFYEPTEDKLVINKDLPGFDTYLDIIKDYCTVSDDEREEYKTALVTLKFKENCKRAIEAILEVLDRALFVRRMKELQELLGKQTCMTTKTKDFQYIINQHTMNKSTYFIPTDLYNYGYIEGVRAERAKRKAKMERQVKVSA